MMINLLNLSTTEDIGNVDSTEVFQTIQKAKDVNPDVIQNYLKNLLPDILAFAMQVACAVLIYIIGLQLTRLIRKILRKGLEKRSVDIGVKQFLDSLTKYTCYFIMLMIILSVFFGKTTTSVVALLGSAGLTVGLALQGSLANFVGGILILVLKPFKVGDYIVEDSHKNEGTVHEISIFYTKLVTVDHKIIVIPNGTLANSSLTNVTQSDKRRVDIFIGVSYQADLKKTKEVIREVILKEKDRLKEEEVDVFVSELADSSVIVGSRVWVPNEKYWEIRWRLMEEIKNALDENKIEIPFPQLDVQLKQ